MGSPGESTLSTIEKRGREVFKGSIKTRGVLFKIPYVESRSSRFFFSETNQKLFDSFKYLYGGSTKQQNAAGGDLLNKQFGTYLTLVNIAESGMFGSTIFDAANALLWDAFAYLNAIEARSKYFERLNNLNK